MAYLSGFAFDIFISYAHVDNLPVLAPKGWVAQFQQQLEVLLWKRIGRVVSVKIWWDPVLGGNHLFDKTIQEKIEASALFVALTSAGYMAAWRPLLSNERGARLFCGSSSNPEKTSLNSGSHTSETTVRNSIV